MVISNPHSLPVSSIEGKRDFGQYLASIGTGTESAKTAFTWHGKNVTYAVLLGQVNELAEVFKQRFQAGDLIAAWLPNGPEIIQLCLAAFRNSMTAMPLNAETSRPELIAICQRARVLTLVTTPVLAATLSESDLAALGINCLLVLENGDIRQWRISALASTNSGTDDQRDTTYSGVALVVHTSGSSGFPKGVVLSQRALKHIIEGRIDSARITGNSKAVVASCLSHSVGLYQVLAYLQAGAVFHLLESYELKRLAHTIQNCQPTHLIMVVSAFQDLLLHPGTDASWFSQLVFASVGADRVPAELQQKFFELTGTVLAVSYGMTELSWILVNDLQDPARSVALGRPTPGVEVRLLDPEGHEVANGQMGEIVARSEKAMSGYLGANGVLPWGSEPVWIRSGDLARMDEDGVYWFEGRIKDLIVLSSGDVVSPAEIEKAALLLEGLEDCIALGVAVRQHGLGNEATEPWLVVTSSRAGITGLMVQQHLRSRLSPHKVPVKVVFQNTLPTSITGKVSRQQISRYLQQLAEPES